MVCGRPAPRRECRGARPPRSRAATEAWVPMTGRSGKRRLRPLLSSALLRSQSDDRLGALAGAGSQPAFTVIFERYRPELKAHAARIVRPDSAEDVVQQALLAAWSALLVGTDLTDLRAWLHRVVHNAALDTIAKRGYGDSELPDVSPASTLTEDLVEGRLSAVAALAAVAALPEDQRRALTLTAIEGRSGRDAARAMGISESSVRQLSCRARSGVRTAVSVLTPLPLVNWLIESGGASTTPVAVGVGGAGGAATLAKVLTVIGTSSAALGAAQAFRVHDHRPPARHAPASQSRHAPGLSSPPPGSVSIAAVPADQGRHTGQDTGSMPGRPASDGTGSGGHADPASESNGGSTSSTGTAGGHSDPPVRSDAGGSPNTATSDAGHADPARRRGSGSGSSGNGSADVGHTDPVGGSGVLSSGPDASRSRSQEPSPPPGNNIGADHSAGSPGSSG